MTHSVSEIKDRSKILGKEMTKEGWTALEQILIVESLKTMCQSYITLSNQQTYNEIQHD